MDDFFDFNRAKARVYLHQEGDGKNMALVSDTHILFVFKGRRYLFQIEKILELRVESKKQLFPLIVGGIMAPFAFLSFFVHPLQPWIHLVSIIIGLFFLYLGYSGKPAIVVIHKNKEEFVIHLPAVSLQIVAFLDYTNGIISDEKSTPFHSLIYLEVLEGMEKIIFSGLKNDCDGFPILGYTHKQILPPEQRAGILLAFDPVTSGREITFQYDTSSNMLRPLIPGPLHPDSQVKLPPWIKKFI